MDKCGWINPVVSILGLPNCNSLQGQISHGLDCTDWSELFTWVLYLRISLQLRNTVFDYVHPYLVKCLFYWYYYIINEKFNYPYVKQLNYHYPIKLYIYMKLCREIGAHLGLINYIVLNMITTSWSMGKFSVVWTYLGSLSDLSGISIPWYLVVSMF